MTNFISSFREGIKASEFAKKNKAEIQSVFDELNIQLASETNGKLQIKIESHIETNLLKGTTSYNAICAFNPMKKSQASEELVKWKMGRHGYPCRIYIDNAELICEDKTSLENNLQIMLSDPVVGEKLAKLMNFEVEETD